MRRSAPFWTLVLLFAVLPTTGCLFRTRPVEETYSKAPLRESTQAELIAIINEQCPFGDTAAQHPVICAVDRGMVRGLLAGVCGTTADEPVQVVLSSRARGDDACAALV